MIPAFLSLVAVLSLVSVLPLVPRWLVMAVWMETCWAARWSPNRAPKAKRKRANRAFLLTLPGHNYSLARNQERKGPKLGT